MSSCDILLKTKYVSILTNKLCNLDNASFFQLTCSDTSLFPACFAVRCVVIVWTMCASNQCLSILCLGDIDSPDPSLSQSSTTFSVPLLSILSVSCCHQHRSAPRASALSPHRDCHQRVRIHCQVRFTSFISDQRDCNVVDSQKL